jgi:hypothetical protein
VCTLRIACFLAATEPSLIALFVPDMLLESNRAALMLIDSAAYGVAHFVEFELVV